jgi:hypothetical protein
MRISSVGTGECERFVTSLKTNKHLIELDLCENLIGTAEVCCSTFLIFGSISLFTIPSVTAKNGDVLCCVGLNMCSLNCQIP